jgi:hypothetical protein
MREVSMQDSSLNTLDGWRGSVAELQLGAEDLELVDLVLCVAPELRIVCYLGQLARRRELSYPVESVEQLTHVLGDDSFQVGDHFINAGTVAEALAEEWFPLYHEGEFLSRTHLALIRCLAEATLPSDWRTTPSPYVQEVQWAPSKSGRDR